MFSIKEPHVMFSIKEPHVMFSIKALHPSSGESQDDRSERFLYWKTM